MMQEQSSSSSILYYKLADATQYKIEWEYNTYTIIGLESFEYDV